MLSTEATAIKDIAFSPDGRDARFVLVTKYSGDIEVTLPVACLQQLQNASSKNLPAGNPSVEDLGRDDPVAPNVPSGVSVRVPQKWLVGADQQRGLVITVLNHQMADQYAFALNRKAAVEFATAVNKQAATVVTTPLNNAAPKSRA